MNCSSGGKKTRVMLVPWVILLWELGFKPRNSNRDKTMNEWDRWYDFIKHVVNDWMRKHQPTANQFHWFHYTTVLRSCTQINKYHFLNLIHFKVKSVDICILVHSACKQTFQAPPASSTISVVHVCRKVSIFICSYTVICSIVWTCFSLWVHWVNFGGSTFIQFIKSMHKVYLRSLSCKFRYPSLVWNKQNSVGYQSTFFKTLPQCPKYEGVPEKNATDSPLSALSCWGALIEHLIFKFQSVFPWVTFAIIVSSHMDLSTSCPQ